MQIPYVVISLVLMLVILAFIILLLTGNVPQFIDFLQNATGRT